MTTFNDTVLSVLAMRAGYAFSKAHNVKGNRFYGSMNVADAIGFERGTLEHEQASVGALWHIREIGDVECTRDGILY